MGRAVLRAALTALAVVTVLGAMPADAGARASAWKLISVTGEYKLHLELAPPPQCQSSLEEPFLTGGDYRVGVRGGPARYDTTPWAFYNGSFGGVIQGFLVSMEVQQDASERGRIPTATYDPDTDSYTCSYQDRSCTGSGTKRFRGGARTVGFAPTRRLGPVEVVFDGLKGGEFLSCDAQMPDPFDIEATSGPKRGDNSPETGMRVRLARFRRRTTTFEMNGSAPVRAFAGAELRGTLTWNLHWKLRKFVYRGVGCIELGRRSGFVCRP